METQNYYKAKHMIDIVSCECMLMHMKVLDLGIKWLNMHSSLFEFVQANYIFIITKNE